MLVQELIMDEINHIPADKLTELYRLVRQFRLGLVEGQPMPDDKYRLRNQEIVSKPVTGKLSERLLAPDIAADDGLFERSQELVRDIEL
jgi:hypothetical protein